MKIYGSSRVCFELALGWVPGVFSAGRSEDAVGDAGALCRRRRVSLLPAHAVDDLHPHPERRQVLSILIFDIHYGNQITSYFSMRRFTSDSVLIKLLNKTQVRFIRDELLCLNTQGKKTLCVGQKQLL